MAVRSAGASGAAHRSDKLTLFNHLANLYVQLGVVSVKSAYSAAVVDDYMVAVTGGVICHLGNYSRGRRIDGGAGIVRYIHPGVSPIAVESAAYISRRSGPDKVAAGIHGIAGQLLKRSFSADDHLFVYRLFYNSTVKYGAGNLDAVDIGDLAGDQRNAVFAALGDIYIALITAGILYLLNLKAYILFLGLGSYYLYLEGGN